MIPKIIHQTAPTRNLTVEEHRLIARNQSLMQGWKFNLHDDADNLGIMREAFPEFAEAFQNIRRGVVQSDIARCVYLYHFGGWYMDTDYKLIRPLDDELLRHPVILPVSGTEQDQHLVCNSVMASEPGHPFWREFLAHVFSSKTLAELGEKSVEATTGPLGLSRFYLAHKEKYPEIYLPPKPMFHPRVTLRGFSYEHFPESYGIHWCWGSWRSKNFPRAVKNYVTRKVTSHF